MPTGPDAGHASARTGASTRAAGVAFVLVATFVLVACNFKTGPLTGGPGLEPPLPSNNEGKGGGGTFANTGGTGAPAAMSGMGGSDPGVPTDMSPMDAALPEPDAGMLMPDASEPTPPDAGTDSHDATVSDAGGVGTCRGWTKPIGECPKACQSCDTARGVCNIACTGFTNSCNNKKLECPTGWACHVACTGLNVCNNGGVHCADGPCDLSCTGFGSCENFTVQCGHDACSATCTSFGNNAKPTLEPGESCNVDGC